MIMTMNRILYASVCILATRGPDCEVSATTKSAPQTTDVVSSIWNNHHHGGGFSPNVLGDRSLQTTTTSNSSIMDLLNADPAEFAIFASLLGKANLAQILASSSDTTTGSGGDGGGIANYTLFAPTNSAFEALLGSLPAEVGQAILGDVDLITKIASYHLVDGFYNAVQLVEVGEVTTTYGNTAVSFTTNNDSDSLLVNGYTISVTDIVGSNGIIHVISDGVLMPPSLLQVAEMKGTLTRLLYLIELTGLNSTLDSTLVGITLLAPDNEAFGKLSSDFLGKLVSDTMWRTHLLTILAYHIIVEDVPTTTILDNDNDDDGENNMTMASWLGDLIEFTVLIDDNETTTILVNEQATIIEADVIALNGRIHIIDEVLLPDWVEINIVDAIMSDPELEVLFDLIIEAGLIDLLSSGEGDYTVFAPLNEAFVDVIPTLTATTERSNASDGQDTSLVGAMTRYHVVEGIYSSDDIVDGLIVTTLLGENITISVIGNVATINGGTTGVIEANIFTNNGIIHKLNAALIPQVVLDVTTTDSPTLAPTVTRTTDAPTYSPVMDTGIDTIAPSTRTTLVEVTLTPETLAPVTSSTWRNCGTMGIVLAILTTSTIPFL
jgi:transforming growth factor-beta-induced protein